MNKRIIKSLIFDLGGVLITNDDESIVSNSSKAQQFLGVDQAVLQQARDEGWPFIRDGLITEEAFFLFYLKQSSVPEKEYI